MALLALLLLFSLCASAQTAPPGLPIIDVHMHAESQDPRFGSTLTSPLTGRQVTAPANEAEHRAECLALMRRFNVVKAVVSSDHHDAVLRWKQGAPEKVLIGYAFLDPAKVDLDFLRKEHAAGRLDVLGEVAPQYEGYAPNDPRLEPFFALAEELDIPIALHMHPGPWGAPYPPFNMPKMRAGNGRPLLLEEVLVRHPKLRIYIMHAGWPFLDELKALLYSHPQVYVDVGVIDWTQPRPEFHRYLRGLVEAGHGQRILFGSDQMVWPEAIGLAIEGVESADFLTAEQKRDIFCRNAARFLRLDPKTCE